MLNSGNLLLAFIVIVGIALFIAAETRAGKSKAVRASEISPADRKAKDEELRRLLAAGEKIQAIKRHREFYHSGLKEAKEAVELLQEGNTPPAGRVDRP